MDRRVAGLVVFYEELADYFLACIASFAEKHATEVVIYCKEKNAAAPFLFETKSRVTVVERSSLGADELLKKVIEFEPAAVFCAGWSYNPYLQVCRKIHGKIPVVLGFDNWWNGEFGQRLRILFARHFFKMRFDKCFVPGTPQRLFAQKIGFDSASVATGAYSCDFDRFNRLYLEFSAAKKNNFPKRFLFAGRYAPEKGIEHLWQAFSELKSETPNEWELWCLGTGAIPPVQHDAIRHFGFVQPKDMAKFISETGVFILPSTFEPWGVVVHEFAAAGFPLLLSDKVGAAEMFLRHNENGFSFHAGNIDGIKNAMRNIMALPDEKLFEMGARSNELSKSITPEIWAETLHTLITGAENN